jgi:DNA-binding FadR family transcriptional regulator
VRTTSPGSKDEAFEQLLARLRQRAASGQPLPAERALVAEYGVTRHLLRRALAALRATGELGNAPLPRGLAKSGAALVRRTNPIEVTELRLAFEPLLARMAALRATPLDIARIMRTATTLAENQSATADLEFHKAIAAGTGNTLAADLYALIRQVGRDTRIHVRAVRAQQPANRLPQRDAEHMAIARAIAARDPEAAEQAMRAHMRMVQRQVIDQLGIPIADASAPSPAAQPQHPVANDADAALQQQLVQAISGLSR